MVHLTCDVSKMHVSEPESRYAERYMENNYQTFTPVNQGVVPELYATHMC